MASMAMCNAIGANTFDIFVCLGVPWTIKILTSTDQGTILINSNALGITVGMLIIAAAILFICLLITKFVLGKLIGWMSTVMYILFLVIACTIEMKYIKEKCDIESPDYAFLDK